jgi:ubiquinone/menaquinone biosynthesis C-methylase UbiE
MNKKEFWYPEARYGGFSDIDGTITFFSRVNSLLAPTATVLDIGCGRGSYAHDKSEYRRQLRILKGKAAQVIGIDVDPVGSENPFLNEFRLINGETWPVEDSSIDTAVCDNVLEHIDKPTSFFNEVRRV